MDRRLFTFCLALGLLAAPFAEAQRAVGAGAFAPAGEVIR
jgi:hypothetical protein